MLSTGITHTTAGLRGTNKETWLTVGKRKTWLSSRGMAKCHALNVRPRNLSSSAGILGCGWLTEMPSSHACEGVVALRQLLLGNSFVSKRNYQGMFSLLLAVVPLTFYIKRAVKK